MGGRMRKIRWLVCATVLALAIGGGNRSAAQTNQSVYADSLQNSWQNWSWATVSLTNTSPIHGGSKSISVIAGAWEALYFEHTAFDAATFTNVSFWIHGGAAGGQLLQLQAVLSGTAVDAGFHVPAL